MDCYFGSDVRKEDRGICNFMISDLGLLHRSVIDNVSNKLVIDFLSLFLLFEFIVLNHELFKGVFCFDIYGSNPNVIHCLKRKKKYPQVEAYRNSIISFINQSSDMKFQFFNILKKENLSFFPVEVFDINLDVMIYVSNKLGVKK